MTTHASALRRGFWLAVTALLVIAMTAPAAAQDKPVLPPVVAPPAPQVTVALHQVDAVIKGPVATVHVTQILRNDASQTAEGVYLFPLPVGAAVSDFQMTVDGKTIEGKLMTAEAARAIYDETVRQLRDPALLEYRGRGLFAASVFPIPAGDTRKLEFTYTQVLDLQDGLYRFNYPLRTRQLSTLPVEQISANIVLEDQPGLRTIYSPNYPLRIDKTNDNEATITFEIKNSQPDSDLDLYFGVDKQAIGLNLLSYHPAGEDGYFVLLAAPGVDVAPDEVVARDLVLVVDISGSMRGDKMEQARAAAKFVVEHLNPGDRFNLIAFSSATNSWESGLQPVDAGTVKDATHWIDRLRASGSTDINRALLEALAQLAPDPAAAGDKARSAYVLFLTDGQPTLGETSSERIVDNVNNNRPAGRNVRLFTFGIGYDVNTDLLDVLSQELGGRASYVGPDERIDEAVSTFYTQISTPVLTDVKLDMSGMDTTETYPYPLPDLFAGEQLVLVGRYRDGGKTTVELSGTVNGKARLYEYSGRELAKAGGDAFVARLWATRKIGALLEQIRRTGDNQELIDSIVELSLQFGIVTPYTSYLVEEPTAASGDEGPTVAAPADAAMPRALADQAYSSVAAAASGAAAAPAAGAAAVQASKTRDELQRATTAAGEQPEAIRYVEGRTFKRQGVVESADGSLQDFWVDTQYRDTMKLTTIEFGSDAYWELLKRPEMAAWLALGKELVIVTGADSALRITAK